MHPESPHQTQPQFMSRPLGAPAPPASICPGLALGAWVVLIAASKIWCGFQMEQNAGTSLAPGFSRMQRQAPLVIAHLVIGTVGLIALALGLRHLRRSHTALVESEKRFQLISSVAMDYVFSSTVQADGDLGLQWVAGAFEQITGYTPEEYRKHGGWRAMVHPDDAAGTGATIVSMSSTFPAGTATEASRDIFPWCSTSRNASCASVNCCAFSAWKAWAGWPAASPTT